MPEFDENPTIEGLRHSRDVLYKLLGKERQRIMSYQQTIEELKERVAELEGLLSRVYDANPYEFADGFDRGDDPDKWRADAERVLAAREVGSG